MPTFLPMMPLIPLKLYLDVNAGRKVEAHELVDRLGGRLMDVDEPLVGADLEVCNRAFLSGS